MEYKFTIDGTLPNLNDYIHQLYISKFRVAELKRTSEQLISAFIKKYLRSVEISKPVQIGILWVEPDKKRDLDNIAAAKKFIFDALVKSKVLQNDGWAQITGFSDSFAVDKENPRIEVTICSLE